MNLQGRLWRPLFFIIYYLHFMSSIVRVFTKQNLDTDNVSVDCVHYLNHVMRKKIGDDVVLVNGSGKEYLGKISAINKKFVTISRITCIRTIKNYVQLGLLFPMIQRLDIMLKMATELGVTDFISYKAQYSQIKFNFNKVEKNIIEAIEQCERLDFPNIYQKQKTIEEIFKDFTVENTLVILCEERSESSIKLNMSDLNSKRIYIIIGPEGGFNFEEIKKIKSYNFVKTISLNKNILRTETAVTNALAIVNFIRQS